MQRIFLAITFLVGALTLGWGLRALQFGPPQPPNIVFILLDALRADALDGTRGGAPIMPKLHDWAERSVHFVNAYTPCSWTRPAMASLLTSLFVDTHGVKLGPEKVDGVAVGGDVLSNALETMPEFFRSHGYATACVQTNGNLTKKLGFAQGFSDKDFYYSEFIRGKDVTETALKVLKGTHAPFFLYAHFVDSHWPFEPPHDYLSSLKRPPLPEPGDPVDLEKGVDKKFLEDQAFTAIGKKAKSDYPPISEAGKEYVRYLYDCDNRYLDDCLQTLIQTITTLYPDTIIAVLADHGEEFWGHGGMGHGTVVYEDTIRVPFFINAPSLSARPIEETVSTIDLLPTLAGLAGFAPRNFWQGQSLFAEGRTLGGPVYSCTRGLSKSKSFNFSATVNGGDKWIENNETGTGQLFNLKNDPKERADLSAAAPDLAKGLKDDLAQHDAATEAAGKTIQRSGEQALLNADAVANLEKLGYTVDDDSAPNNAPK